MLTVIYKCRFVLWHFISHH